MSLGRSPTSGDVFSQVTAAPHPKSVATWATRRETDHGVGSSSVRVTYCPEALEANCYRLLGRMGDDWAERQASPLRIQTFRFLLV